MSKIAEVGIKIHRVRNTRNRMEVLDALYHSPDWMTSVDLKYLPVNYRTIQKQLRILTEMGLIIREDVRPAYRYRIDKTKDLSYYHEYMTVFRMNERIARERCQNF